MSDNNFVFHVQNLAYGWCRVLMLINDKDINFNAEYLGPNPLTSFITACLKLKEDGGGYKDTWLYHDIELKINMELDDNNMLHLDIKEQKTHYGLEDEKDEVIILEEWHEVVRFECFESAIISEGFRVLNAFGLWGYRQSWMYNEDFPLTGLLHLIGKINNLWKNDSCTTSFVEEINLLQQYVSKIDMAEETKMDVCAIYYESWQMQCCGDPFSVGEKVEWTCHKSDIKLAHGIILDFDEDHHGFATHSITGIVTKIIAERSETPKGSRPLWYDRIQTIQEEIQSANGWESVLKDDEKTDREFWGYIVYLKDVTVKLLKDEEQIS